jgi:cytosine/adenosine deaminase-related metal-dependent hydrolase
MKTLIKLDSIVTMDSVRRVIRRGAIVVDESKIERILTEEETVSEREFRGEIVDATNLAAIPGFIQTHIHLCQTLFRGLADDLELLDWLKLRIFPFEAAHNDSSMRASALLGLAELIRSGTTTIMDMGSVHHEEEVVRAIDEVGLRAFVGKAMMDQNDIYPGLREPTKESISSTLKQAEQWHRSSGGRIQYAVAPRFVLSCTDELLRGAYELTQLFPGMLFHTHAAENRHELEAVRKRCHMDNIEFFESIDVLQSNTCLAHCIWLNEREIDALKQHHAKVLHCPSSNLKLGSGVAKIPALIARGITVSLGADGAPCNNTLDMFHEMRLAALIQKPVHGPAAMGAQSVFEMATLGGAATLGMDSEVGSIEPGKKADLVLIDLDRPWNPLANSTANDVYSAIVYSCSPENVHSVMVDGRWLYRNRVYASLDQSKVVQTARNELRKLQQRVV